MKKTCIYALVLTMLLSLGFSSFRTADVSALPADATAEKIVAEISDSLSIKDSGSGLGTGDNAGHGNHQTRIVHTSHGDYAAYVTDSIKANTGTQMDEISVIKINADGTTTVVMREWKNYDTSQVSLHVDKDENVWAVTVADNKLKANDTKHLNVAAYRIDAETDAVTGHKTTLDVPDGRGFGYSTSCIDVVNNKIYTMSADAAQDNASHLFWAIFDMETLTWEPTVRSIDIIGRHCYHYMYADGNGGLIVLCQRDVLRTNVPGGGSYPEIRDNEGLTADDLKTFGRWPADYVWDELDLFYIADVYEEAASTVSIMKGDYSQVIGDQDYRNSLEGRSKNLYPNNQNNNGGDTFLDADGYLHIIYNAQMLRAAYDRKAVVDDWYHKVVDISDPANLKVLSEQKLVAAAEEETTYSFRMYQDTAGNLYYISGETAKNATESTLKVYLLKGTPAEGYTRELLNSTTYVGSTVINISNNRSNSYANDVIDVIWMNGQDYNYRTITLDVVPTPAEFAPEDVKIDLRDQNGKQLAIGDGEFTVKAMLDEDHVITGKVAADGTVTFDAFELTEEGQYIIQVSMDKGTDDNVKYSEEVYYFGVVVERDGDELVAHRSGIVLNQESVDEAVFHVVKTIKNPDSGDHTQVWLWVALAGVAVCAGAIALVLRKKSYAK